MVNQDYNVLNDWMFGKLTALLENIEHNPKYPILKMSLGEPTLGIPKLAKNILDLSDKQFQRLLNLAETSTKNIFKIQKEALGLN